MKKKLLALLMSVCMVFGIVSFSSCKLADTFDNALELEEFKEQVEILEEENKMLKQQLATLKFEHQFPNGLVTESCNLNNVIVGRAPKSDSQEDLEDWKNSTVYAVRADGDNVNVTINGGAYDSGFGASYNVTVWAHNNSSIVINDGYFTTGNDLNDDVNHIVYAAGGSTITINGGYFEVKSGANPTWMLNCQDNNGTIIVKGGTFVNFDPSNCVSEGENTSFVAEGYMVVKETVGNTNYYTVVEIPLVEDNKEVSEGIPIEF